MRGYAPTAAPVSYGCVTFLLYIQFPYNHRASPMRGHAPTAAPVSYGCRTAIAGAHSIERGSGRMMRKRGVG